MGNWTLSADEVRPTSFLPLKERTWNFFVGARLIPVSSIDSHFYVSRNWLLEKKVLEGVVLILNDNLTIHTFSSCQLARFLCKIVINPTFLRYLKRKMSEIPMCRPNNCGSKTSMCWYITLSCSTINISSKRLRPFLGVISVVGLKMTKKLNDNHSFSSLIRTVGSF